MLTPNIVALDSCRVSLRKPGVSLLIMVDDGT